MEKAHGGLKLNPDECRFLGTLKSVLGYADLRTSNSPQIRLLKVLKSFSEQADPSLCKNSQMLILASN